MHPFIRLFSARHLPAGRLFVLLCAAVVTAATANAATLIVTTPADSGAGSLRAALAAVSDGDTIQFDAALNGQTINLTSAELAITKNITINGPGSSQLAVSGSNALRIFHVMPGHTVIINGLTIRDGSGNGGGVLNDHATLTLDSCVVQNNNSSNAQGGQGGGVYNNGSGTSATLTLLNSTVSGNSAYLAGGGLYNYAANGNAILTIVNSVVNSNLVNTASMFTGSGGGIHSEASGGSATLTITKSIVSNNRCGVSSGQFPNGAGGGIYNQNALTITDSTISGNEAGIYGGGIYNSGTMTITSSTLSGNRAPGIFENHGWGEGGGLVSYGNGTITNSTFSSNNSSYAGGGVANRDSGMLTIKHSTLNNNTSMDGGSICNFDSAALQIAHTILKNNSGFSVNIGNHSGTVASLGYNISSDNGSNFLTGPGDQINTDPTLGPLQDNGGPTFTHSLLAGSPALDAGNPSFTPPPSSDQRGFARVFNGRIDIGALEVQPPFISGTVSYCSNPALNPVPGVTMTLTGTASTVTTTDASGNYTFAALAAGGSYTVTPTKPALAPGSPGINTSDAIAVQRHFLSVGIPLTGCRLTAADVNIPPNGVNTVDAIAIQRFFLSQVGGLAQTGTYVFNPVNKSYSPLVNGQIGQTYDALILGDVATGFVHRPEGSPQSDSMSVAEPPASVATLSLPNVAVDAFVTNFNLPVTTAAIDAKNQLVGFQGDFSFDERVITFQSEPVQPAGLTARNWNVSGNVMPGPGPIRTLRVSAFSLDFAPLSGTGTLFELRMNRVSKAAQSTPLLWAAGEDQFIFIDADLNPQKPGHAPPGSVTRAQKRR